MSSEISTEPRAPESAGGFQVWHLYLLLGLAAATWAVIQARDTHPAALILLTVAVLAAGAAGAAVYYAVAGFSRALPDGQRPLHHGVRRDLEQEKAMVLRAIKELEFDRAMRKVSDRDFAEIDARLRARAVALMEQLEQPLPESPAASLPESAQAPGQCWSCGTRNDGDARFCKTCGERLADG